MVVMVWFWFLLFCEDAVSGMSHHSASWKQLGKSGDGSVSCPVSCSCGGEVLLCSGDKVAKTLNLSSLNLIEVPTFEGIYDSLTTLDLSGNSITCLHEGDLASDMFPSLEKLDLSYNRLKSVESEALTLPLLRELDLSENRLKDLDFLTGGSTPIFSEVKLSGNSFACEDLEESLTLLCSEDWQELIDGISCTDRATRVNNNNTTYPERSLRELCNMSIGVPDSGGDKFPVIPVGTAVGGAVMLIVMLAVSSVFLVFMCLKAGRRKQRSVADPSPPCRTFSTPSPHYAPPTSPPIPPPPLEIPSTTSNTNEIYAQIMESPATSHPSSALSNQDYEDGYILTVESVPDRKFSNSSRKFGLLTAASTAPLIPPPPPPSPSPSPSSSSSSAAAAAVAVPAPAQAPSITSDSVAGIASPQQNSSDKTPSEPNPYSALVMTSERPQAQSRSPTSSVKEKPPVKPRRLTTGAKEAAEVGKERRRGKTFTVSPNIASRRAIWEPRRHTEVRPLRARPEGGARGGGMAEYLKVVL